MDASSVRSPSPPVAIGEPSAETASANARTVAFVPWVIEGNSPSPMRRSAAAPTIVIVLPSDQGRGHVRLMSPLRLPGRHQGRRRWRRLAIRWSAEPERWSSGQGLGTPERRSVDPSVGKPFVGSVLEGSGREVRLNIDNEVGRRRRVHARFTVGVERQHDQTEDVLQRPIEVNVRVLTESDATWKHLHVTGSGRVRSAHHLRD